MPTSQEPSKKREDIREVHIFDVDGPLYSRDTIEDFITFLMQRNRFDRAAYEKWKALKPAYREKHLTYHELAQEGWKVFAAGIRNMDEEQLARDAQEYIEAHKQFFHSAAVALLRKISKDPHAAIVLLSASPTVIVGRIGKALGIHTDMVYGTEYPVVNKRFVGLPPMSPKDSMLASRWTSGPPEKGLRPMELIEMKATRLINIRDTFSWFYFDRFKQKRRKKYVFYGDSYPDFLSYLRVKATGIRFVPMNPTEELKGEWKAYVRKFPLERIRPIQTQKKKRKLPKKK